MGSNDKRKRNDKKDNKNVDKNAQKKRRIVRYSSSSDNDSNGRYQSRLTLKLHYQTLLMFSSISSRSQRKR